MTWYLPELLSVINIVQSNLTDGRYKVCDIPPVDHPILAGGHQVVVWEVLPDQPFR